MDTRKNTGEDKHNDKFDVLRGSIDGGKCSEMDISGVKLRTDNVQEDGKLQTQGIETVSLTRQLPRGRQILITHQPSLLDFVVGLITLKCKERDYGN